MYAASGWLSPRDALSTSHGAASSTTAAVPSSAISRASRLSLTSKWACRWPGCAAARPRWSSRSFRPAGDTAGSSAVRRQTAFWSCAGQPRTPCPSPLRALAELRAAAGALPAAGAKAAAAAGRRNLDSLFSTAIFASGTTRLLALSALVYVQRSSTYCARRACACRAWSYRLGFVGNVGGFLVLSSRHALSGGHWAVVIRR